MIRHLFIRGKFAQRERANTRRLEHVMTEQGKRKPDPDLSADYRFWARVSPDVAAIVLLPEVPEYPLHPFAVRPVFPPGVCTGCGCTDRNPCIIELAGGDSDYCGWLDEGHTRCSGCGGEFP